MKINIDQTVTPSSSRPDLNGHQPLVRVQRLQYRHDAQHALLEDVNLELYAHERIGLRGANGSGKSTLLHLLMGLHLPTLGQIDLFGELCRNESQFAKRRGQIGLVFQDADDQLFCPTTEEDVAFGPLNQGLSHAAIRQIVDATLANLRISHLAQRPVHHLSGGEKRLVALAGVLAMQPQVMLLDEPTTGLDDAARHLLIELIQRLPQAMLIASHDQEFLDLCCTRQLQLQNGSLVALPAHFSPYVATRSQQTLGSMH